MAGAVAGAVEDEEASALEDAIDDGVGEVTVVEGVAPVGERRLVGGEDHGPLSGVAVVDDVEEHVGGVVAVGEVADLVDHEDVRVGVGGQGLAQAARAAGAGQVVDEGRRGDEARGEAALDGLVGDGDGEVRLPSASFPEQDEVASLGDQLGAEVAAEQGEPEVALEGEVEVVDRLHEGEAGVAHAPLEAGVATVGGLLGEEDREEGPVRPPLGLGAGDQVAPGPARVGKVEALEDGVQVDGVGIVGERGGHAWASGNRVDWRGDGAPTRQRST